MKVTTLVTLFLILSYVSRGQELHEGELRWSSERKITESDYKIKVGSKMNTPILSQFTISHSVGGFDFLKRNLNQKIENKFIGQVSWIDSTQVKNISRYIEYQQLLFDVSEVYARKFRKQVLKNKAKLKKGFSIVSEINNAIMSEFAEARLEIERNTEGGNNIEKLQECKDDILKQLSELKEFSFENKKKIRL